MHLTLIPLRFIKAGDFADGADAAAPSGLQIVIRFLSGASRRPSSDCSGRLSTRARPPLIRSTVSPFFA
jgi:hypothetical protein